MNGSRRDFIAGYMAAQRNGIMRKRADIEWSEDYNGTLWAHEDAGGAGIIQFNITPTVYGEYLWAAYAEDADLELCDGVEYSFNDAEKNCETVLRNIKDEFDYMSHGEFVAKRTAARDKTAGWVDPYPYAGPIKFESSELHDGDFAKIRDAGSQYMLSIDIDGEKYTGLFGSISECKSFFNQWMNDCGFGYILTAGRAITRCGGRAAAVNKKSETITIKSATTNDVEELIDAFDGFAVRGIMADGRGNDFYSEYTPDLRKCWHLVHDSYDFSTGYGSQMMIYVVKINIEVDTDAELITVTGWSFQYD